MSASSLSLPIFLRINFLISYLDSNRLTEHIRLTHTESFAEWQKAGAGRTSRAFKHPGHDVTAPDVWPSILTDYTYDSELDNADGVPLAFRRSSMFPEGNTTFWGYYCGCSFFFFFENCCWHLLDTGMLQKITTEESETDSSGKPPFFSNVKHFE